MRSNSEMRNQSEWREPMVFRRNWVCKECGEDTDSANGEEDVWTCYECLDKELELERQ